jgi:hypothetical protein
MDTHPSAMNLAHLTGADFVGMVLGVRVPTKPTNCADSNRAPMASCVLSVPLVQSAREASVPAQAS